MLFSDTLFQLFPDYIKVFSHTLNSGAVITVRTLLDFFVPLLFESTEGQEAKKGEGGGVS